MRDYSFRSRVAEVSILLGYDAVSLGNRFLIFRNHLYRKVRIRLSNYVTSYFRRNEASDFIAYTPVENPVFLKVIA